MLKMATVINDWGKAALGLVLLALVAGCSSSKTNEEIFSLYLDHKTYDELVRVLRTYSARHGYRVTNEIVHGNRPETTAQHVMVEGGGVRILIQSALAERCKEREGRRDVEYSSKIFDVNVFASSNLTPNDEIYTRTEWLKGALTNSGFRIVSIDESCDLL